MLSEEMVRRASGQFDLSSVAVLTLPGLGLSGFEKGVLAQCTSLHTLDLSGNNLRDCPAALSECTALKRLDLSGNKITNLIGVELPSTIEELRIQGNQLSSAKDMKALSQLPNLQALYLRGADGKLPNPVCQANPEYPVCILELLPDLANLDGMVTIWMLPFLISRVGLLRESHIVWFSAAQSVLIGWKSLPR
eukprot:TRINITY_DN9594_c0_g2_i4.p1 TRINITY_DN9594_c0_g2~~TRINITY_DN9594_c0_g2_i4.p1  ORF type:complete len:193 (-),score=38.85 TRINITY_DN9594_c0_g2_i4:355-933(-)